VISASELRDLLGAEGSESSLRCVQALTEGAEVGPIRESTELAAHLHWVDQHREALVQYNGAAAVKRFVHYLKDPSTGSVLLATVGLQQDGSEYFTAALDQLGERVILLPGVHQGSSQALLRRPHLVDT
jgi:hypothetical protein